VSAIFSVSRSDGAGSHATLARIKANRTRFGSRPNIVRLAQPSTFRFSLLPRRPTEPYLAAARIETMMSKG
jgi:hypothetical protein